MLRIFPARAAGRSRSPGRPGATTCGKQPETWQPNRPRLERQARRLHRAPLGCRAVARLETATDGRWVWPRDLAYYVDTYHIVLPSEFVEHMRRGSWNPPSLSREDLMRIEDELFIQSAVPESGSF